MKEVMSFKLSSREELKKRKREQVAFVVLIAAVVTMVIAILKF